MWRWLWIGLMLIGTSGALAASPATSPSSAQPGALPASKDAILIKSFAAEVNVGKENDIGVAETIKIQFTGAWEGIFRDYQISHTLDMIGNTPCKLTIKPAIASVTDERGKPLDYRLIDLPNVLRVSIDIPKAKDATRTVVIRYRVANAVNVSPNDDHKELNWNVTGDGWEVPIETATARINLPDKPQITNMQVYTGPAGSRFSQARIKREGAKVEAATLQQLAPKERLAVLISWNPGKQTTPKDTIIKQLPVHIKF